MAAAKLLAIPAAEPIAGYGRHWRELFCSITPSARPFVQSILRSLPALVRSAYFGFLGPEFLDFDQAPASKDVLC
jgi:hypothetical protein